MSTCAVCIQEKKSTQTLTCNGCQTTACIDCQRQYAAPACMNCAQAFNEDFFLQQGKKKLIAELLRPAEEKVYWDREKQLLSATQKVVEYEAQVDALRAKLRFGIAVRFPVKPNLIVSSTGQETFPCPVSECRGFAQPAKGELRCGVCKQQVCSACRELQGPTHSCDPNIVESIRALQSDTKPCPRCVTRIIRSAGCNHMFCTNCRTHFDWVSGKILSASTNHHYDRTEAYNKTYAAQPVAEVPNMISPARTKSHPIQSERLQRWLFADVELINGYLLDILAPQRVMERHDLSLIAIRCKFLRNEISEKQAMQKVWILEKALEVKQAEQRILSTLHNQLLGLRTSDLPELQRETAVQRLCAQTQDQLIKVKSSVKVVAGDGPILQT